MVCNSRHDDSASIQNPGAVSIKIEIFFLPIFRPYGHLCIKKTAVDLMTLSRFIFKSG